MEYHSEIECISDKPKIDQRKFPQVLSSSDCNRDMERYKT